ncbi:hypothetical protein [Streptomyces sp. NPDC052107]|uniref:hypothetical protein n=1 Tax=Streptomyces sp. NPDC052107 TaxID=3155632 RepID=UPI0034468994
MNPVKGMWPLIRCGLANAAFFDPEHLIAAVRRALREIPYRPWHTGGALAGTGLCRGSAQ